MVIWLIGLSGSGKTTTAIELKKVLELTTTEKWVIVDGDFVRAFNIHETIDHSIEGRKKNGQRIQEICSYLDRQGVNVICAILSLFPDQQRENQNLYSKYFEIYLKAPLALLKKRDNKGVYQSIQNVVGLDIDFIEPPSPNLTLNIEEDISIHEYVQLITAEILGQTNQNNNYPYTRKNLLTHPEKYQYSNYIGQTFFSTYQTNRESFLENIENKISRVSSRSDVIYLNSETEKKIIDFIDKKNDLSFISILIKKFEATKKIYSDYLVKEGKTKKSPNSKEAPIRTYVYFAKALTSLLNESITHQDLPKLYLENCFLKVCDLIVSAYSELILPDELEISKQVIQFELTYFRNEYADSFAGH